MTDEDTAPSSGSTSADLATALGVDHLHPPEIGAFFGGLPRRVTALLDSGEQAAEDGAADSSPSDAGAAGSEERFIDELTIIVDALDELIDRTKAVSSAIDPEATADPADAVDLHTLPSETAELVDRIEAGATEVTRRLAGLSSAAWQAEPDLLDQARSAVVAIAGPLRSIERRAEEPSDTPSSQVPQDPTAQAAERAANLSAETVPQDQADLDAAQRALEIANDTAGREPPPSAPSSGGTDGPTS